MTVVLCEKAFETWADLELGFDGSLRPRNRGDEQFTRNDKRDCSGKRRMVGWSRLTCRALMWRTSTLATIGANSVDLFCDGNSWVAGTANIAGTLRTRCANLLTAEIAAL